MKLRRWLVPSLLLLLVTTVALLPATPLGREWLLGKAVALVDDMGYRLEYDDSSGNPWSGVRLAGARIEGPGVELSLSRLAVGYFLPSLIAGELPLSLELEGVRGDLAVGELELPAGGSGNAPVSLRLREVDVRDVAVDIDEIPWTLPPLSLEDVTLAQGQDAIDFAAILASAEGRAEVAGSVLLEPLRLDLQVIEADATLARHWWPNVTAGTLSGELVATGEEISGDFRLAGGSLHFLDEIVTELSGPVSYDGGVVRGDLDARLLGGPASADVTVNIPARRWNGEATGEPALAELAGWLAGDAVDVQALSPEGRLVASVSASGWDTVELSGRADGEGSVLELPLQVDDARFGFESGRGVSVNVTGQFAGGGLEFVLEPQAEGFSVQTELREATPYEELLTSLQLSLDRGPGGWSGNGSGSLAGSALDRAFTLDIDGRLDSDGLQVFVSGSDELGAAVEGAAVLDRDTLDGQVGVAGLTLPVASAPLDLSLQARGPLDALPLELSVAGPGAAQVQVGEVVVRGPFTGVLTGVLSGGDIEDISGRLGPVAVTGDLELQPLTVDLEYQSTELAAAGPVDTRVQSAEGRLSYVEGRLDLTGRARGVRAQAFDATLGPVDLSFEAHAGAERGLELSLTEEGEDPRLAGAVDAQGVRLQLAAPPLSLSGEPLSVTGDVNYQPDDSLFGGVAGDEPAEGGLAEDGPTTDGLFADGELTANLRASGHGLDLEIEPAEDGHLLSLTASPGTRLGPLTLGEELNARGTVSSDLRSIDLSGVLGETDFQATAQLSRDGPIVRAALSGPDGEFEIVQADDGPGWRGRGSLRLDDLGTALGLPVMGSLEGELGLRDGLFDGELEGNVEASGVPLTLRLEGAGESLNLSGSTELLGDTWSLEGRFLPAPEVSATSQLGTLRLSGNDLSGSGSLSQLDLEPLTLPPLDWQLSGSLSEGRATLQAGSNTVDIDWSEGARLSAQLDQAATLALPGAGADGTVPLTVRGRLGWRPGGSLEADASLEIAGETLAVTDDDGELVVSGDVDLASLTSELGGWEGAEGRLTLSARVDPADPRNLVATGRLYAPAAEQEAQAQPLLSGEFALDGGAWSLSAAGEGVEVSASPQAIELRAQEAPLSPLLGLFPDGLADSLPSAVLDGTLARSRGGEWSGELSVSTDEPSFRALLSGDGETLTASANGQIAGVDVNARGSLLPELDLELAAAAPNDLADFEGRLTGPLAAPNLTGRLRTADLDAGPLAVGATEFAVEASLADGLAIRASGPAGELRLSPTGIDGQLAVPVTLVDEEHLLSAALSGTPEAPAAEFTISGPLASGVGRLQGGQGSADLDLVTGPLLPAPLDAAGSARLSITGSPDQWRATLQAPLSLAGEQLLTRALVQGSGQSYTLLATVESDVGQLLQVNGEGVGANWSVQSNLAHSNGGALAALLPFEAILEPSGTISATSGESRLDVSAALEGTIEGVPFSIRATGDAFAGLELQGEVDEASFTAMVSDGVALTVGGTLLGRPLTGGGQLSLAGSAAAPSAGEGDRQNGEGRAEQGGLAVLSGLAGTLDVGLGDSRLTITTIDRDGGTELVLALVGEDELLPLPLRGEARVLAATDGTLALEELVLVAPMDGRLGTTPEGQSDFVTSIGPSTDLSGEAAANGALVARLAGPLWPQAQLSGELAVPLPGEDQPVQAEIAVSGWDQPRAFVSALGLALEAELAGAGPRALLSGSGSFAGVSIDEASLLWTGDGFAGGAGLALPIGDGMALRGRLGANADGELLADLSLSSADETLARTRLVLGDQPWRAGEVRGEFELDASSALLLPGYDGEPLLLTGEGSVGGTIATPSLTGRLSLAGATTASGQISYAAGALSLELSGSELELSAVLEEIVSGRPEIRAAIDLDLAALPVGADVAGRAVGELAWSGGSINGTLALDEVRLPDGDATLSGDASIAGTWQDPQLSIDLQAGGSAAGELQAEYVPAQELLVLNSDLRWGGLSLEASLESRGSALTGGGRLALPGGEFTFTAASAPPDVVPAAREGAEEPLSEGEILLVGAGSYAGWQARLDPHTLAFSVQGDLSALPRGVRGRVTLASEGLAATPWLRGSMDGVAWSGVELGAIELSARAPGAPIELTGEDLTGSVDPFSGFAWQVDRLTLELPQGFDLVASGAGRAARGELELQVAGNVAGQAVALPLTASSDDEGYALRAAGELLGGSVELDARLAGGEWRGNMQVAGVTYAGSRLDLTGRLTGEADDPRLRAQLSVAAPSLAVSGVATLSLTAQEAQLAVASPLLDEPLGLALINREGLTVELESGDELLSVRLPIGAQAALLGSGAAAPEPEVSGAAAVSIGPVAARLQAVAEGLQVQLSVPALPGLELAAELPATALAAPAALLSEQMLFTGQGRTEGEVALSLSPPSLEARELRYVGEGFTVTASGAIDASLTGSLSGSIELSEDPTVAMAAELPAEAGRSGGGLLPGTLPFELSSSPGELVLHSTGELGELELRYDLDRGVATLDAALLFAGEPITAELEYRPGTGPSGEIRAEALDLALIGREGTIEIGASVTVSPERLNGEAQLAVPGGTLQAQGEWGLGEFLPERFAPLGASGRRLELQLGTFDPAGLPVIARRLPYLDAPMSGFLEVREGIIAGRLVSPDLTIAGEPLPVEVEISGSLEELVVATSLAGSPVQVTIDGTGVSAIANLERFPLHRLAEAAAGPTDVSSELTGVARLTLPWQGSEGLLVEVATELVRLERAGVVTTGNVSLTLAHGQLTVNQASFNGAGSWEATGTVGGGELDFRLEALDADFTPLLGLVPVLAEYGVEAQGSVTVEASGSLDQPSITLASPELQLAVSGARFLLAESRAALLDDALSIDARLSGLAPITGELALTGSGRLELQPVSLADARFDLAGAADVPWLGPVSDFRASIQSTAESPLWLSGSGELGNPFTIEGSLLPLDLRLRGDDLALRQPQLLLASAQADADVRLAWGEALSLSGSLAVDDARFELGIRPPRTDEPRGEPSAFARNFHFEGLAITAPGRVRFNENFGSAEASLDLLLTGTAAQPQMSGVADVLRGSLRFSGREFEIRSAQARFDPSRGILPLLDVTAQTTFEMGRVMTGSGNVRFLAPPEGNRFTVTLAFTAEVEPTPGQSPPFRLDISPTLSSQAVIQEVRADGTTSGPRGLTPDELLSLVALGRLELDSPLTGEGALATAVAEGAIDTAVDFLFVAELQNALSEALGIDLVEIETTALSTVIGGESTDPFSVSLRLGGYLSDEVFASYRIGTVDEAGRQFALTNEVNLVYDIGPLELDLAGRFNFAETLGIAPSAEISAALRYDVYGNAGLEAGIDLSDESQQVRFGVTLRW